MKFLGCSFILLAMVTIYFVVYNFINIEKGIMFLISYIGIMIAYFQYQINAYKLKLDLYTKRYKIYEATSNFIKIVPEKDNISRDNLNKFYIDTVEAKFLFKEDVIEYLDNLIFDINLMDFSNEKVNERIRQKKRTPEEQFKDLEYLQNELENVSKIFKPYLDFRKIN